MNMHPIIKLLIDTQESIVYGEEHLGEIQSEYRSECALFGDAWPGALCQLAEIRRMLKEEEDKLRALNRHARKLGLINRPAKPVKRTLEQLMAEDIPF